MAKISFPRDALLMVHHDKMVNFFSEIFRSNLGAFKSQRNRTYGREREGERPKGSRR